MYDVGERAPQWLRIRSGRAYSRRMGFRKQCIKGGWLVGWLVCWFCGCGMCMWQGFIKPATTTKTINEQKLFLQRGFFPSAGFFFSAALFLENI
ncbi:unnamed protein product [Ceratitis capitata]|uniref:(Mediterranean fruit fly) hypothetical protein n=1 Tax=Ceratitis capitata TaxID=7213 RepID=A0A811UXT2_CERCA|nr:unnamed protein product [Ceratitis capitata]